MRKGYDNSIAVTALVLHGFDGFQQRLVHFCEDFLKLCSNSACRARQSKYPDNGKSILADMHARFILAPVERR